MNTIRQKAIGMSVAVCMIATLFAGCCIVSSDQSDADWLNDDGHPLTSWTYSHDNGQSGTTYMRIVQGAPVNFTMYEATDDDCHFDNVYLKYYQSGWKSLYLSGPTSTVSYGGLTMKWNSDQSAVLVTGNVTKAVTIGINSMSPDEDWNREFSLQLDVPYEANLTVGTPFSFDYEMIDDCVEVMSATVTQGTLPAGLTLNTSNGQITGTPTQAVSNSYVTIKFHVTDGDDEGDSYATFKVNVTGSSSSGGSSTSGNTAVNGGDVNIRGENNASVFIDLSTAVGGQVQFTLQRDYIGSIIDAGEYYFDDPVYEEAFTFTPQGLHTVLVNVVVDDLEGTCADLTDENGTVRFTWGTPVTPTLTLSSVEKQYAVAGGSVSFSPTCTADPTGASVSYTTSNVQSGLTVSIVGSTITCSASAVGTYTFTLNANASGYDSDSKVVTVQFVPKLAFTNSPSAGALNA